MEKLYRVRNWEKLYERNRTRDMVRMHWLALPVKIEGDGYLYLMDQENGAAIFGAFVAILEVAALCEPRGTLIRSTGVPHDERSLARKTRMDPAIISQALEHCTSKECKWLEFIDIRHYAGKVR